MRAVSLALVAMGFAVGAAVVYAGDPPPSMVGKDAPPIDTKEFLQSDGRTQIADFKGEVLFIECFATW